MKLVLRVLLVLVCALAPTAIDARRAPEPGLTIEGFIPRVRDGDTPIFAFSLQFEVPVRMSKCWVPDEKPIVSARAKRALEEYALGKKAVLHIPASTNLRDIISFERVVGELWLKNDTKSLSEYQVGLKNASTVRDGQLGE